MSKSPPFTSWHKAVEETPSLSALLFDLDGTLVDTMALHYQAYAQVFSDLGGTFTRADFDRLIGPPAAVTIPLFADNAGLDGASRPTTPELHAAKKDAFEQILADTTLDILPAAQLLIDMAQTLDIAVVTSGNERGARAILTAAGLIGSVSVLVTGDDVRHGKPDPEPYQLGLHKLGQTAPHGLAFEDHDNGIDSALNAGLRVIDVRTDELRHPLQKAHR